MRSSRLSLATVVIAASAGTPVAAGAAELPTFNCGAVDSAISWSSAFASQPTFYDSVSGTSGTVGCDAAGFNQPIARKAGKGQQEFLKITLAEAFISDGVPIDANLKLDHKITHKLVDIPGTPGAYETYFDLTQFAFNGDTRSPFAELFLGLKITSLSPFVGDIGLKWDTELQTLSALIPLQDTDATLRLTSAPSVPEPATWALLTTGLVGTGALMRRRRQRAW